MSNAKQYNQEGPVSGGMYEKEKMLYFVELKLHLHIMNFFCILFDLV